MRETLYEKIDEEEFPIIIYEPSDVKQEFEKKLAMTRGAVGILKFLSAAPLEEKKSTRAMNGRYVLTFWSKVTLTKNLTPVLDIAERAVVAMHRWNNDFEHCSQKAKLGTLKLVENDNYLIYAITITKQVTLL